MCVLVRYAQAIKRKLPFGWRVYLMWVVIVILGLLPLLLKPVKQMWRLLSWISPILLALDADAGNRPIIYCAKGIVWAIMQAVALHVLEASGGLSLEEVRKKGVLGEVHLPIMAALLVISCSITLAGHILRKHVFAGSIAPVESGSRVSSIEAKLKDEPYMNKITKQIRTPLKPCNLKGAWIQKDGTKNYLKDDDVHFHVLRTSLVTQYVVGKLFKSHENRVYVYSPVARYRARIVAFGLALAGLYHVIKGFFTEKLPEAQLIQSMLLWLTLPTITLPAVLKVKFGPHVRLGLLLRGLLPVENDKDLCSRLHIEPKDLYSALMNANNAEAIMKQSLGILNAGGKGTVHVTDLEKARTYCRESMIRVGDHYIRISDGLCYVSFKPGVKGGTQFNKDDWWREEDEKEVHANIPQESRDDHVVQIDKENWTSRWSPIVRNISRYRFPEQT